MLLGSAPATALGDAYVDDDHPVTNNPGNDCLSPGEACDEIQEAIDAAGPGETVHVGGGDYNEHLTLGEMKSLVKDDFLTIDTAGTPIIDDGGAPVTPTILVPAAGPAGTISGLRIHGAHIPLQLSANADVVGNTFDDSSVPAVGGGDVLIGSGAGGATVTGNMFSDPDTTANDRGVAISSGTGSPEVSGNDFDGYRHAIAVFGGSPTPLISGNEVTGTHANGSNGSSIFVQGGPNPTISDNFLHSPEPGTSANGVEIRSGAMGTQTRATLQRNDIRGHTNGVRVLDTDHPDPVSLDSDLIVSSALQDGLSITGVGATTGEVIAQNVTVVHQSAPLGTNVSIIDADLTLDSSILVGGGIVDSGSATCMITSSRGPVMGAGCDGFQTTDDPMFLDADNGDYHLSPASPLVDQGSEPEVLPGASTTDIDGEAREIDGGGVGGAVRDMGADEMLDSDGDGVIDLYDPTPFPPNPPPPPAQIASVAPSNDFELGKLKRNKKKGIAFLFVNVPGPGEVGLAGKGVKNVGTATASARKSLFTPGGVVKLRVKPGKGKAARKVARKLKNKGKAKLKVRVTFVPTGGVANTQARKVKLVRK